jgi:hypothetical protein
MFQKIVTFFKTTSTARTVTVLSFIVIGFLTSAFITARIFRQQAFTFAQTWRANLQPVSCAGDRKTDLPVTIAGASPAETARLKGQFQELQDRMKHHFDVMITFYAYNFSTIIMVGVLASVAAICLLFITSKGWEPSNVYAKTIFLVATASATYCAAFPSIFQQDLNLNNNKRLYLEYVSLANEMCSYVTTRENIDGDPREPSEFIHYTDLQLKKLNTIAVGFDPSKIPDFASAFSKGTGLGGTPPPTNPGGTAKRKSAPVAYKPATANPNP